MTIACRLGALLGGDALPKTVLAWSTGALLCQAVYGCQACIDQAVQGEPMRELIARTSSSVPLVKRAFEAWPYVLIAVSVIGLSYVALTSVR